MNPRAPLFHAMGCPDQEENMNKKLLRAAYVAALAASPLPALAADPALERIAAATRADDLQSVRYAGDGVGYSFGQAYKPGEAWPKIRLNSFTRTINYDTGAMREEIVLTRAEALGGGGYPHTASQRNEQYVHGAYAWNQTASGPAAGPRFVADRVHQLWITPYGVIKSALRNNGRTATHGQGGKLYTTVTFAEPGRFRAVALIDDAGRVQRVESRAPDAVLGETKVVTTYEGYADFGGFAFPTHVRQTQAGAPVLDVTIREVVPNAPADITLPEAVKNASERITIDKVADGVWFLAGGSHNSVAIEMKDHMILVETPLNDGRSGPVIDEVKKLVPGKPIRYVVNSHTHFDHSGGLRAAVAEGATIVTQAQNKPYFQHAFATPNTIAPDLLAKSGKKAKFLTVGDKMTMRDATRSVELYHVADSHHSDTFLMVYLPKERILIEADSFTPGAPNSPPPSQLNPNNTNLVDNLKTRGLAVDKILPLHGRVVPGNELYAAVGEKAPD
jgi:glyoxylase-like metal-dependent hydrolase (beta-lactamase superfamily II)